MAEINEYEIAEGPQGIKNVLEKFVEKAQNEPDFKASANYMLYQMGNQQSLIRVDLSKEPYQFWYTDLNNRAATQSVKQAITEFLRTKFPDNIALTKLNDADLLKEYFHDIHQVMLNTKLEDTQLGTITDLSSAHNASIRRDALEFAIKTNAWEKVDYAKLYPPLASISTSKLSLFAKPKEELAAHKAKQEEVLQSQDSPKPKV